MDLGETQVWRATSSTVVHGPDQMSPGSDMLKTVCPSGSPATSAAVGGETEAAGGERSDDGEGP